MKHYVKAFFRELRENPYVLLLVPIIIIPTLIIGMFEGKVKED